MYVYILQVHGWLRTLLLLSHPCITNSRCLALMIFQVMENGETYTVLSPRTNPPDTTAPQQYSPPRVQPQDPPQPPPPPPVSSVHESNIKFAPCTSSPTTVHQSANNETFAELIYKSSPALLDTIQESPQKRRRDSPDQSDLDVSFKRRRNSSFIASETPCKRKFKDILKTPVNLFSRRRSVALSTITSQQQEDESSDTSEIIDTEHNDICSHFNQSYDTPVTAKEPNLNNKPQTSNDEFKDPNVYATPKNKSFFKKGFRKSFMSEKNSLKNITEYDCSYDDVDVSMNEYVKTTTPGCTRAQTPSSSSSCAPHALRCDAAGPDNCRLSTSSVRVLTLNTHLLIVCTYLTSSSLHS